MGDETFAKTVSQEQFKRSEKLFRTLIEKSADMMTLALPDGKMLYISPSVTRITGFTLEEYQSRPGSDFVHPDDVPGLMAKVATVLNNPGHSVFIRQRVLCNDGSYVWCEGTITNMLQDADIGALVSNFRDITDKKHAEDQLRASENRFRSIIEQFPYPVITYLPDGTYVNANKAWELMWQEDREKVRGYNIRKDTQLEASGLSKYVEQAFDGELAVSEPYLYDPSLIGQTGRKRWMQMTLYPLKNSEGMLVEVILVLQDVTEQKETEEKIKKAETNYRELFEKANEAIYVHEMETGRVLEVNQKAMEITGFTRQELLNNDPQAFITDNPDYSFEKAIDFISKAAAGPPQQFEWLGKTSDGSSSWYEVNLKRATIAGSDRILAFFKDINDRKKTEANIRKMNEELEQKVAERTAELERYIEQLKEGEDKFEKAFQASAAGITITRLSDSTYLDVNDAFGRMTGYSKRELVGHTSREAGLIVDVPLREAILKEVKESGFARNIEMRVHHKSGRIIDVLSSIETILLSGEKYAINIIYDITDRKKAEEQLRVVNSELESFTYSVSHDLRAPLRAIDGYSKILEQEYDVLFDAQGKRFLKVIQNNSLKMSRLIDDLLAFSRLGRKTIVKSALNMKELTLNALADFERAQQHNADVKVADLHAVPGDYSLIYQVMINLISNAIKYSSKKEHPTVVITSVEQDDDIVYSIADNGVGFEMKYADKLFGVFQRLHTQGEFEGTGVGLAIAERIIAKHGGRIWAESELDNGANFSFSLPRRR